MDLSFLSLFSGIGLHDLGLSRAGWTPIGQCEIDPFCNAVLEKHWPGLPRWKDVKDVTTGSVKERCSAIPFLITGGFPCQQISSAGKGEGIGTEEEPTEVSGLWWEMRRVIEEVRPAWLLVENVPALRTRGADAVLHSLERLGYACWPIVVGSWAVGAPHKRDRVWLVANDVRQRKRGQDWEEGWRLRARDGGEVSPFDSRRQGTIEGEGGQARERSETLHGARWPARPGERQHDWESPRLLEPGVGRPTDGASRRVARRDAALRTAQLKAIGNANPPQVVEALGRAIKRLIEEDSK